MIFPGLIDLFSLFEILIISLVYANCEAFMRPILLHHIEKKEKFNRDKVYKYQNFSPSRKLSTLLKFPKNCICVYKNVFDGG